MSTALNKISQLSRLSPYRNYFSFAAKPFKRFCLQPGYAFTRQWQSHQKNIALDKSDLQNFISATPCEAIEDFLKTYKNVGNYDRIELSYPAHTNEEICDITGEVLRSHKHTYHDNYPTLWLILENRGFCTIDGETEMCEPGTVLQIPARTTYSFTDFNDDAGCSLRALKVTRSSSPPLHDDSDVCSIM
ncbi:MAG TPA: hypothetical protein VLE95_03785 [Chlamydiales bacterium]|nr:hypothetical protein [Chlamydiales bacterium]